MSASSRLAGLQAVFARALAGGDDGELVARLAGDLEHARRRAAIYREAVSANAVSALRSAYPVIERLVGAAFFDEAARRHLAMAPPRCGDLNRYGDGFPAFLADYPHAATLPWLADVARLEWAWHEALMAADAGGLDFVALARIPERDAGGLRFAVHPSVRLVRSSWPVLAVWEANQPERDGTPGREEGQDTVLVWRRQASVRATLIEAPEATFLERLIAGMTLESAADVPGEWDLPETLRRFSAHGVICGFSS